MNENEFNPKNCVDKDGNGPKEVWMVESNFGSSAICETYTLIYNNNEYSTVNVYNKVRANGFCFYTLNDYNKLIKKLEKKGYKRI